MSRGDRVIRVTHAERTIRARAHENVSPRGHFEIGSLRSLLALLSERERWKKFSWVRKKIEIAVKKKIRAHDRSGRAVTREKGQESRKEEERGEGGEGGVQPSHLFSFSLLLPLFLGREREKAREEKRRGGIRARAYGSSSRARGESATAAASSSEIKSRVA